MAYPPDPVRSVDLKITGEVQVLRLGPGDRVIVTLDGHTSPQMFEKISKAVTEQFPDNEVIVLGNGIRIAKEVAA